MKGWILGLGRVKRHGSGWEWWLVGRKEPIDSWPFYTRTGLNFSPLQRVVVVSWATLFAGAGWRRLDRDVLSNKSPGVIKGSGGSVKEVSRERAGNLE